MNEEGIELSSKLFLDGRNQRHRAGGQSQGRRRSYGEMDWTRPCISLLRSERFLDDLAIHGWRRYLMMFGKLDDHCGIAPNHLANKDSRNWIQSEK